VKQYLYSVKFKKDHRKVFKKGQEIFFKPGINLLVGDQGCGKSSLLQLFRKDNKRVLDETITYVCDVVETLGMDTEKDNPRTLPYFGKDMAAQLNMMFSSHGQSIYAIMKGIESAKNKLILIDEPEAGLSIRSQVELAGFIKKAIENGCQIVLATHSLVLLTSNIVDSVFNMEKMEWENTQDFVDSCFSENKE